MVSTLYCLKLLINKNIKSHCRLWWQVALEIFAISATLVVFLNLERLLNLDRFDRGNQKVLHYNNKMDLTKFQINL